MNNSEREKWTERYGAARRGPRPMRWTTMAGPSRPSTGAACLIRVVYDLPCDGGEYGGANSYTEYAVARWSGQKWLDGVTPTSGFDATGDGYKVTHWLNIEEP